MKVVSGLITVFVAALRARDDVIRVQFAFAVVEVREEEDRPFAIRASNDDIPSPCFRLEHRGTLLSECEIGAGCKCPGCRLGSFAKNEHPEFSACDYNFRICVCTVADKRSGIIN